MSTREADDHPRYACRECGYDGNDYALLPSTNIVNGSTKHDTAVCPDCHGRIYLWSDVHR